MGSGNKSVKTKDIKKGDWVITHRGWKAKILDNAKGTTRMAEVHGIAVECGSIYSFDIVKLIRGREEIDVELTEKELHALSMNHILGFR